MGFADSPVMLTGYTKHISGEQNFLFEYVYTFGQDARSDSRNF
jgi:hypothetical protein